MIALRILAEFHGNCLASCPEVVEERCDTNNIHAYKLSNQVSLVRDFYYQIMRHRNFDSIIIDYKENMNLTQSNNDPPSQQCPTKFIYVIVIHESIFPLSLGI